MIKGWMHEITLAVQARTGVTVGLFVALGILVLAALTAFIFLCVAGYDWFALQFGSMYAALIMTGIFLLIAVIAALSAMAARSRARQRAILERAAHSHGSWLLDPKIVAAAVSIGRSLGWQRLLPMALLGFMAAQWAREYRHEHSQERERDSAE